jgi:type IV secretory pathway TrbL component
MRKEDYQLSKSQIDSMETNIKVKGTYHFVHKDINGNIKDSWSVDNLITNAGLAGLAQCTDFTYIALGTSSTAAAASQTALGGEITDSGLERASATVSYVTTTVTNDTKQLFHTFTLTGSKTVEEVGIFSASSGGTMLSRALTGSKTFLSGEIYEVTYKLKYS